MQDIAMTVLEEDGMVDSAVDSKVIEELGHYAVNQYNKEEGKKLVFTRVVAAKQELLQGVKYYLDVEAREGLIHHHHKIYEAVVWVCFVDPGVEEKSLQKFQLKGDDNVAKLTEHSLTELSVDDPAVVEAAERAVDKINEKRQFAVNYALVEVKIAKAKLIRVPSHKIPTSCLGKIALSFGHTGTMREQYEIEMKIRKVEVKVEVEEDLKAVLHHCLDGAWIVKKVEIIKSGWSFE